MAQVFLSYSRKDKDFVRQLNEALVAQKREAWVDWKPARGSYSVQDPNRYVRALSMGANRDDFSELHLEAFQGGVAAWNSWRAANPDVVPQLGGADLHPGGVLVEDGEFVRPRLGGIDLSGAILDDANLRFLDLTRCNLRGACLFRANLHGSILVEADLSNAHLDFANLMGADLSDSMANEISASHITGPSMFCRASLQGAYFVGANLRNVNFEGANLRGANLRDSDLIATNLTNADLTGATLRAAIVIGANVEGTTLTACSVYGTSVWDLQGTPKDQSGLIVTTDDQPVVKVDNLLLAQFVYLLLNRQNLRDILMSVTQRGVLILGRFGGGGIDLLNAVAAQLRVLGYLPLMFDFERPRDKSFTETVQTLAGLSRFAVVDLSGPSVPQELYATVPHFKIPFVPILERGKRPYAMFTDLFEYDWVLRPIVEFADLAELMDLVAERVVKPAEARYAKRGQLLQQLSPLPR